MKKGWKKINGKIQTCPNTKLRYVIMCAEIYSEPYNINELFDIYEDLKGKWHWYKKKV
jgi:hypothetical protein